MLLQSKLEQAVTQGSIPVATAMILEGAEPDWEPEFIRKGRYSDKQGFETWSPYIFLAARSGNKDMLELLWEYGANIDAQFTLGHNKGLVREGSPLMVALFNGDEAIVQFLLENGADTEVVADSSGHTAILALAYSRRTSNKLMMEIDNRNLQRLIDANAGIDQEDHRGRTSLWYAAFTGKARLAETLLRAGADTTSEGDCSEELNRDTYEDHCTAERIAEIRGYTEVIAVFR
jgi:ankyrin repeat protein